MRNYEKILSFILAILLALAGIGMAKVDRVSTDICEISFDLNIQNNYTIGFIGPDIKETYEGVPYTIRGIFIDGIKGNGWDPDVRIDIYELETLVNKTSVENGLKASSTLPLINLKFYDRIIDGKDSFLMVASSIGTDIFKFYLFPEPGTLVEVDSRLPWDAGTSSLLKTIHVKMQKDPAASDRMLNSNPEWHDWKSNIFTEALEAV